MYSGGCWPAMASMVFHSVRRSWSSSLSSRMTLNCGGVSRCHLGRGTASYPFVLSDVAILVEARGQDDARRDDTEG